MEVTKRRPQGAECQCTADGCGLFFSSESAFEKHWTKDGHKSPDAVGLVAREGPRGPVWGWPGMPADVLERRKGASAPDQARGIDSWPVSPVPALSEPGAGLNKPGAAERAMVGARGPSGGIMAKCVACGRAWERERKRGRPADRCEECRS